MSAFQYGWNGAKDAPGTFWVKFNPCTREPLSWKEELYAAARSIAASAKKPLWLCFSGGIDSEIMCRAFFDQGIKFSVLTLEYGAHKGAEDLEYARAWCRDRAIEQHMYKIEASFFTDDIPRYIEQGCFARNAFRYALIKAMEIVDSYGGHAVLGAGELGFRVDPAPTITPDDIYVRFMVANVAPFEWCRVTGAAHEPYFYFSTPEITAAYLRMPLIAGALQVPETFLHERNRHLLKRLNFLTAWPDIEAAAKHTTSENIAPLRTEWNAMLKETLGSRIQEYDLRVPDLRAQLLVTN